MTNDQRLKVISTVKQLLGLVGENAAPKTLVPIASAIIELGRVEGSVDVQTLNNIGALYSVDLHSAALFPPDFPLFAFLGRWRDGKLDKVARRTFKLDDIPPSGVFHA